MKAMQSRVAGWLVVGIMALSIDGLPLIVQGAFIAVAVRG